MPSVVLVVGWYCLTNRWNQQSFGLLLQAPNSKLPSKIALWHILCSFSWISNWHLRRNYYFIKIFFRNFYSFVLHYENVLGGKWNDQKQILDTKGPQKSISMVLKPVRLRTSESWAPGKAQSSVSQAKDPELSTNRKTDQLNIARKITLVNVRIQSASFCNSPLIFVNI